MKTGAIVRVFMFSAVNKVKVQHSSSGDDCLWFMVRNVRAGVQTIIISTYSYYFVVLYTSKYFLNVYTK